MGILIFPYFLLQNMEVIRGDTEYFCISGIDLPALLQ